MNYPGNSDRGLTYWVSILISIVIVLSVLTGCKKLDPERIVKIETGPIIAVSSTTCSLEGTIFDKDKNEISEHGFCWSPAINPLVTDFNIKLGGMISTGDFQGTLTGLTPGTTYYVKAYSTNSANTTYGNQISFTTIRVPIITTTPATSMTNSTATSGGNITSDGGDEVEERGVCWSKSPNPTTDLPTKTNDGTGTGVFTSSLTGLSGETTYYVRAYAKNTVGTEYGEQISFKTTSTGTVTDIEGNIYKTVTIGTQTWMAENLKTTILNNGTEIPEEKDNNKWKALSSPGYCWYNNDSDFNKNTYGALYNWYTVSTNLLCPEGWHVPSNDDWDTLILFLGGPSIAGGKLKEKGFEHWASPNAGASDEYSFKALPAGQRNQAGGEFYSLHTEGFWWSRDSSLTDRSYAQNTGKDVAIILESIKYNVYGFSVRCVMDQE